MAKTRAVTCHTAKSMCACAPSHRAAAGTRTHCLDPQALLQLLPELAPKGAQPRDGQRPQQPRHSTLQHHRLLVGLVQAWGRDRGVRKEHGQGVMNYCAKCAQMRHAWLAASRAQVLLSPRPIPFTRLALRSTSYGGMDRPAADVEAPTKQNWLKPQQSNSATSQPSQNPTHPKPDWPAPGSERISHVREGSAPA